MKSWSAVELGAEKNSQVLDRGLCADGDRLLRPEPVALKPSRHAIQQDLELTKCHLPIAVDDGGGVWGD
jgi:hypothetical protein